MLEGGGRCIAELSGWTEDGPLLPLDGCRLQVGDGVWLGLTVLWEDGELLAGGGGGGWVSAALFWAVPCQAGPRCAGDSHPPRATAKWNW